MSCYEWSHGTITLPSAAFAGFHKTIRDAVTADLEHQFAETQAFWKSLTNAEKADLEKYRAKLRERTVMMRDSGDERARLVDWKLEPAHGATKPRRILKSDYSWPTNRSEVFHDDNLMVSLNRAERTATYSVDENNHAREWAAKTPLHAAWERAIEAVRWTRGTGGVILGNDEYTRDAGAEYQGGGGSYVVDAYGYVGIAEAPSNVREFTNSKGERIGVEVKYGRDGRLTGKAVLARSLPRRASAYGMYR